VCCNGCATVCVTVGRPYPDAELTVAYNPLQAGLWHAVHFDKGCYMGQETIAKVLYIYSVVYIIYATSHIPCTE
jgi:folate-binding protein YgfZ